MESRHSRTTLIVIGLWMAIALVPARADAQRSGIQSGITFAPPQDGGSGLGFVTGWYASGDEKFRSAPADFLAELTVGAQNFQAPAFFGRAALLLRLKTRIDDDLGPAPGPRVHFLIGPQVEWRRGNGSVVAPTGSRPDLKLVLGGDVEIRDAFLELRYAADLATETRSGPAIVHITPSGARLVPSAPQRKLSLKNGTVMVTVGMRLR
jgi:hypothetical protein